MKKFYLFLLVCLCACNNNSLENIYETQSQEIMDSVPEEVSLTNYQWDYLKAFNNLMPYVIEAKLYPNEMARSEIQRMDYWYEREIDAEVVFCELKESTTTEDRKNIESLKKAYILHDAAQVAKRHNAKLEDKENFDKAIEKLWQNHATPQ